MAQVFEEQSTEEIAVRKKGPLNRGWVLTALRMLNAAGLGTWHQHYVRGMFISTSMTQHRKRCP